MKPIKSISGALAKSRNKEVEIAKETLEILKNKSYVSLSGKMVDISESLDQCVKGTKYYPNDLEHKFHDLNMPVIEVTNETTAQAAARLLKDGKDNLVALNFASARNPGGGWLHGAKAQEEDLVRCSGLYSSLKSKPLFYNANILNEDHYYTDGIIYSPQVPFFRDVYNLVMEETFPLSIITSPAPNVSAMKEVDQELLETIIQLRAMKILQVAQDNGHKNIILGAWGCGIFGNDPNMVALAFMKIITMMSFEHVCFAIYDTRPQQPIFEAFKSVAII